MARKGTKAAGCAEFAKKIKMIRFGSWADQVENFERVSALEGEVPVFVRGRTELWEKERALETLQTFPPQRLYSAWGNGTEVVGHAFAPIASIVSDLESLKQDIRSGGTGTRSTRKATEKECLAETVSFLSNIYSLLTELAKLFRAVDSMMIPLDPGLEDLQIRLVAVAEEHSPSYLSNQNADRLKGTAARLRQTSLNRDLAYCVTASAVVGVLRIEVKAAHRRLIEFKIRFDKANPDVAAWMGR